MRRNDAARFRDMEAGTWVALVLGIGGAAWSIAQFFVSRNDARDRRERERLDAQAKTRQERDAELERRWVQEKRLVYIRVQAALSALLDAEAEAVAAPLGTPERQVAFEARDAAWMRMDTLHAELDLLAPDIVRDAVWAADQALEEIGATMRIDGAGPSQDPIETATTACRRALNSMRADLGIDPVREWRTSQEP